MAEDNTRTYERDGIRLKFDFDAFTIAFISRAKLNKKKIGEYEAMMADSVSVTASTVHAWRMRKNAPGDLEIVGLIADFMNADADNFLLQEEDKDMGKLTESQRGAVARVYSAITDFLFMLNNTDGCVWHAYSVPPGSPCSTYLMPSADAAMAEEQHAILSGTELADAAYNWTCHVLEREWVSIGNHPVYAEIAGFMYGTMNDIYDGKTDPDYRFHYMGKFDDPADEPWEGYGKLYEGWIDQEQAYREIRDIVTKYL